MTKKCKKAKRTAARLDNEAARQYYRRQEADEYHRHGEMHPSPSLDQERERLEKCRAEVLMAKKRRADLASDIRFQIVRGGQRTLAGFNMSVDIDATGEPYGIRPAPGRRMPDEDEDYHADK